MSNAMLRSAIPARDHRILCRITSFPSRGRMWADMVMVILMASVVLEAAKDVCLCTTTTVELRDF